MGQKLTGLQREKEKPTATVEHLTILPSQTDRSRRQSIIKGVTGLNDTISQQGLTDICRLFHPTIQNTFFSNTHGTFTETDHLLGLRTHTNTKEQSHTTPSFRPHGIELEVSNRKRARKSQNAFNHTLPINTCVKENT